MGLYRSDMSVIIDNICRVCQPIYTTYRYKMPKRRQNRLNSVSISAMSENLDEKMVSYRVFLPEQLRTEFKVCCARDNTNMSEKTRELVEKYIQERQQKAS